MSKLRDFYYRTALGRSVQKRLQTACRQIWPSLENEILAGYGFASPLLRPFLSEASHIVNLMPAEQGVMAWPPSEKNLSALCTEAAWPLGASSIDRLLVLHGLENAINIHAFLNEFSRVLSPDGRAILLFANRVGAWGINESTPFGLGRHFSINQLEAVLNRHQLEIIRREGALYGSPWRSRLGLRTSNMMEAIGEKFSGKMLAGVWVLEVKKSAMIKPRKVEKREPIFVTPELRPAGALRSDKN